MFQIDTSNRGRDKSSPYNIWGERSKVMGMMYNERERESRQVLLGFAKSIQERDVVTYDHSRRVATYAQRLARYLGWSRRDARDLALAGLVHDLGKTWIENDILNRSEEHTSELQSLRHLVCRLLLEKKKKK